MANTDKRGNKAETQTQLQKKMSVREYKDYAISRYGKNSVNDSMLKSMERSVGSADKKTATVEQLHHINAKMKIRDQADRV